MKILFRYSWRQWGGIFGNFLAWLESHRQKMDLARGNKQVWFITEIHLLFIHLLFFTDWREPPPENGSGRGKQTSVIYYSKLSTDLPEDIFNPHLCVCSDRTSFCCHLLLQNPSLTFCFFTQPNITTQSFPLNHFNTVIYNAEKCCLSWQLTQKHAKVKVKIGLKGRGMVKQARE